MIDGQIYQISKDTYDLITSILPNGYFGGWLNESSDGEIYFIDLIHIQSIPVSQDVKDEIISIVNENTISEAPADTLTPAQLNQIRLFLSDFFATKEELNKCCESDDKDGLLLAAKEVLSGMTKSEAKRHFKLSKPDEILGINSRELGDLFGLQKTSSKSETAIFDELEEMGLFKA